MSSDQQQITKYFTQNQYQVKTLQTINNYSRQVLTHITSQIAQGTLQIDENSRQFTKSRLKLILQKTKKRKASSSLHEADIQKHMQQLKILLKQKNETIGRLNKIYDQQRKIIALKNHQKMYNSRAHHSQRKLSKMQRSFITVQQKIKIKGLVKAKHQFQQQLQSRVNKILGKVKQRQIEQQKSIQHEKQEKIKRRRHQMLQQHKKFEIQIKQYKQSASLSKNRKTERKIYIYQEKQKQDRQKSAEHQRYIQMLCDQKREKMKTDFDQIKQHALQHNEIIQRKRIQSEQAIMQKSKCSSVKYPQTDFLKKLKQEQEEKRVQQQNKIRIRKDYNGKIKQFRQYVRQNFSPNSNEKSKFVPKQNPKPKDLTLAERFQLGNKYLQVARKMKRSNPASRQSTEQQFLNPQNLLPRYPNYLKNLHQQRALKGKNKIKTQYSNSQEQLKRILSIRDRHLTQGQVHKAVKLTKAIQNETQIFQKNKYKEFDLIKDKLRLLEAIVKK